MGASINTLRLAEMYERPLMYVVVPLVLVVYAAVVMSVVVVVVIA